MKNKNILKRIVAPVLCVVLLCCAFAMPVNAATGWYEFEVGLSKLLSVNNMLYTPDGDISPAFIAENQVGWNIPSTASGYFYDVDNFHHFDVSAGDLVQVSIPRFRVAFTNASNSAYGSGSVRVRVAFYINSNTPDFYESPVLAFDETRKLNSYGQFTLDLNAVAKSNYTGTFSHFRVIIDSLGVSINTSTPQLRIAYPDMVTIAYGDPNSPEAPSYSSPSSGDLESLEDIEQELESNTAEGQEEVQEIISPETLTSTLLSYANGLQFTSRIMLSAITKIPFLNALIWVSMSLGFVATLFALSASIIAASDRRAGATARAGKHSRR